MKTKTKLATILLLAGCLNLAGQNSLWINNPDYTWYWQAGTIREAALTVHPCGLSLQYGIYLTFSAQQTGFDPADQLEVVLDFELPEGTIVVDNWLWVGSDIVQGRIIDRWSASDIYEGIVDRKRDPSVLYKNGNTQYQLRVYPIRKNETRKVKITCLVPVNILNNKVEAGIPARMLMASAVDPDLYVFAWEENGFANPSFSGSQADFTPDYDAEFGSFLRARLPAGKLSEEPSVIMDSPSGNGIYLSTFEGPGEGYYQLALNPGDYLNLGGQQKILVLFDYEAANTSASKSMLASFFKQQMLACFGEGDLFNMLYSRLKPEQAFEEWQEVNQENLDTAIEGFLAGTTYSNLPGLLAGAIAYLQDRDGDGSIVLITNTENFANYDQANALIKDLKKLRDPMFPIFIADIQNQNYSYQYIGNRYYLGQEYLYVNLAKGSGGYYRSIREEKAFPALFSKVLSSVQGMITAFDIYTAPSDGFCYGRFSTNNLQGFPVNQPVNQLGKYYGTPPFVIYLTGIFRSEPFSQLIQVPAEEIFTADSSLSKMWHGRYIQELEKSETDNAIIQEILYESLTNRILSRYSAFLCLEPGDSVDVCTTCKDESRLVGIWELALADSAGIINVYPNPFTDRLNLEIDAGRLEGAGSLVIRIFSLTGQLLWEREEPVPAGGTLHVEWQGRGTGGETVPAGQYIVMIQAGPAVWSRQVIKSE